MFKHLYNTVIIFSVIRDQLCIQIINHSLYNCFTVHFLPRSTIDPTQSDPVDCYIIIKMLLRYDKMSGVLAI
ncbi:predicted protein [Histoplasma mississippiense (nom. inval.)]|uniref:predicted protein n=1 Tax=Ajellomyces capsulatus (strain NAm1 / WU24) TaxID=2059318 RepID=UPI000157C883|nr:predicted protein [Histoplasma mississippiense (nom. inval.)]EDN09406.1 predicted protein [Histoplasma mississippiense (nom. inval.)]